MSGFPTSNFILSYKSIICDLIDLPKTVLVGFLVIWFVAPLPTKSSVSLQATHDGLMLLPCSLGRISTQWCKLNQPATKENVIPKSILIVFVLTLAHILKYVVVEREQEKDKKDTKDVVNLLLSVSYLKHLIIILVAYF